MASPPGDHRAVSTPRGSLAPLPSLPHFPSRATGSFPQQQHLPGGDSDGGDSVEEFDEDEGAELVDRAAEQPAARSSDALPLEVNKGNRACSDEWGEWSEANPRGAAMAGWQHSHMHNCETRHYGHASCRGDEPASSTPREMRVEDGYGVIGRREGGPASSYWDLLRAHLSDPLTGILMDDAMILSCGHSYGSNGTQHIHRMKACGKCGQPITEDSIRPNLALRLAVQAFRREEDSAKTLKRRRGQLEQDKYGNDDPNPTELSRGRGVQFPFAVSDRVIIKGNKRTPERFVGRVAVVTTQCLNGWYVVKTSDNAESVKLQYRSLGKFVDGSESSAMVSNNDAQNANWL